MGKKLTIFILGIFMIGTVHAFSPRDESGTEAEAKATLDRPWYVQLEIQLKEFWKPIGDIWSWIADALLIDDSKEAQKIG